MPMGSNMGCIVRPWRVTVGPLGGKIYVARRRGDAIGQAWRAFQAIEPTGLTEFMLMATVERPQM
jgi:hypothetical protein